MNIQTTVRARTANKKTQSQQITQHMTLMKVVNTEERCFGFATTDGGANVYIPARVVKLYNMTSEDAYSRAGFKAPLRMSDAMPQGDNPAKFICETPVTWDGAIEEIEVGAPVPNGSQIDPDTYAELENDFDRLASTADDQLADIQQRVTTIQNQLNNLETLEALRGLEELVEAVTAHRSRIDDIAPEAV